MPVPMFTPHGLYIKTHNPIHTHTHTRAESEIRQSPQHYSSQHSQIDTSIRARGGIKGGGRGAAVGRRARWNEWESWLDVWCIIHVPAGIMLDPAVRVRVRQLGRRARPVKERGCVDVTPGRR